MSLLMLKYEDSQEAKVICTFDASLISDVMVELMMTSPASNCKDVALYQRSANLKLRFLESKYGIQKSTTVGEKRNP